MPDLSTKVLVTVTMDNLMIARVAKFADLYRNQYMRMLGSNVELMRTHWWHAFRFLIMKLLIRGRRRVVSRRIREMVEDACDGIIDIVSPDGIVGIRESTLSKAKSAFEEMEFDGKSYKSESDIQMIFGTEDVSMDNEGGILRFLRSIPSGNIIEYSIHEIREGNIGRLYETLCTFVGVGHIGASTYLRDLVDLFYEQLDEYTRSIETQAYLLPVDACVYRVANESGIVFDSTSPVQQARTLAEACHEVSIVHKLPLDFNQGATWLCENTFNALMWLLKRGTSNEQELLGLGSEE